MDLNQFSTVDIVLDKANDNIIQRQTISAGDRDGRSLTLQVTNEGSIGEVPGLTANLLWTNHSSGLSDLSAFSVVDRTTSVFKIEYPQNMLTAGKVTAQIQLLHNGKVTHSKKFEIIVLDVAGNLKGVLQTAEYTALVEVLAKANEFETDIADVTAQLAQIAINLNNFSRIIPESNDAPRIRRALDYAKSNKIKNIFAPAGQYVIDEIIEVEGFDGLKIYGEGEFVYGNNLDKGGDYFPIFKLIASKNITFCLTFKGDGTTFVNNNRCAILCEGDDAKNIIENINIEHCYFYNWSSFVIRLNSARFNATSVNRINVKNINIRFNKFYNIHTALLTINGGVKGLNIKYNEFERLSGNAIKIDSQLIPINGEIPGDVTIENNVFKDFNPVYRNGTQTLQAVITLEEKQENIRIVHNKFENIVNSENGILQIQQGTSKTGLSNIEFIDNIIDSVTSTLGMLIHLQANSDGEKHKNISIKNNKIFNCSNSEFAICNGIGQSIDNISIEGNEGTEIKRLFNNLSINIDGVNIKNNKFDKCNFLFIRCNESIDLDIQGNKVKDCVRFAELINSTIVAKSLKFKDNEFSQVTTHTGALQAILINLQGSNSNDYYLIKDNNLGISAETENQVGLEVYFGTAKCIVENVNVGAGYGYGIVFRNAGAILKFSSVKGQKLAGLYTADNTVYGLENKFDVTGTYGAVRGTNYKNQNFANWV